MYVFLFVELCCSGRCDLEWRLVSLVLLGLCNNDGEQRRKICLQTVVVADILWKRGDKPTREAEVIKWTCGHNYSLIPSFLPIYCMFYSHIIFYVLRNAIKVIKCIKIIYSSNKIRHNITVANMNARTQRKGRLCRAAGAVFQPFVSCI